MPDEEITRVIFRTWYKKRDLYMGEVQVIALFPDEKEDRRPGMVNSFMHIGQHGAAHEQGVMDRTRPSTEEEYAPLKRELESPPYTYRLKILKRRPHERR